MLKDAGYKVPEINMEAYMKVRALVQEFMDDFLGLYISPKNRLMNSLLIGPVSYTHLGLTFHHWRQNGWYGSLLR